MFSYIDRSRSPNAVGMGYDESDSDVEILEEKNVKEREVGFE